MDLRFYTFVQDSAKLGGEETGGVAALVVGDMLWARVPGHPYWPCMVYPDPSESLHTKILTSKKAVNMDFWTDFTALVLITL